MKLGYDVKIEVGGPYDGFFEGEIVDQSCDLDEAIRKGVEYQNEWRAKGCETICRVVQTYFWEPDKELIRSWLIDAFAQGGPSARVDDLVSGYIDREELR